MKHIISLKGIVLTVRYVTENLRQIRGSSYVYRTYYGIAKTLLTNGCFFFLCFLRDAIRRFSNWSEAIYLLGSGIRTMSLQDCYKISDLETADCLLQILTGYSYQKSFSSGYEGLDYNILVSVVGFIAQKIKFSIEDFFSKFDQIRRFCHIYWRNPSWKTLFSVQCFVEYLGGDMLFIQYTACCVKYIPLQNNLW